VEHAFLAWLAGQPQPPVGMTWASTPRNEPFAQFLGELTGEKSPPDGGVSIAPEEICERFARDVGLFKIVTDTAVA
jgi:hypothetical protein